MAKYTVIIKEVHITQVEVEATSLGEARHAAEDLLESGEAGESIYSHTIPSFEWPVLLEGCNVR
jgi:hypothetical protein